MTIPYIYPLTLTMPNKRIFIRQHEMQELFKHPFNIHRRLRVFAEKGLKCAYCGKLGVHLITSREPKNKYGGVHTDVYTKLMELMTIDHTIPISRGGTDDINNLEPCCQTCNSRKSDKLIPINGQNTSKVTL